VKSPTLLAALLACAFSTFSLSAAEQPPSRDDANELKHRRESEPEWAALIGQCQKMVALQIAVRDGTKNLHKQTKGAASKKPPAEDRQALVMLAESAKDIVGESKTTMEMLKRLGPDVAFTEVFAAVHEEMLEVQRRLENSDVGVDTQLIAQDIIDTLTEMIAALQKT
jgi:hypothetical protein